MKDAKPWIISIIVTIVMNLLVVTYVTTVFKTTVEQHLADKTMHLNAKEKVVLQEIARKTVLEYERKK